MPLRQAVHRPQSESGRVLATGAYSEADVPTLPRARQEGEETRIRLENRSDGQRAELPTHESLLTGG